MYQEIWIRLEHLIISKALIFYIYVHIRNYIYVPMFVYKFLERQETAIKLVLAEQWT